MDDKELLLSAAKAAGLEVKAVIVLADGTLKGVDVSDGGAIIHYWHPLADDGDALRLAVLLSLRIEPYTGVKILNNYPVANITDVYSLHSYDVKLSELHGLDPNAAARRAIVRAAAQIGELMR